MMSNGKWFSGKHFLSGEKSGNFVSGSMYEPDQKWERKQVDCK